MGRAGDERKIGRGGELGLGPGWAAKSQVANIPEIVGQASQHAPGGEGIPSAIATFKVGSGLTGSWAIRVLHEQAWQRLSSHQI